MKARQAVVVSLTALSLVALISFHLKAFAADNPNDPCYKTYQLDMLQCNQYDCKVNPQLADCQTLYQYCTSEARSRYDLCKGSGGGGNPGLGCATLAGYECITCCEQAYPCVFEGGGPECGYNSCTTHCGV
jgi:hypothetical protein